MTSLSDELLSIPSIYSDDTFTLLSSSSPASNSPSSCILRHPALPSVALRLEFPPDYPDAPPSILGTHSVGDDLAKGTGHKIVAILRAILAEVYTPGVPVLFDLLEESSASIASLSLQKEQVSTSHPDTSTSQTEEEEEEEEHGEDEDYEEGIPGLRTRRSENADDLHHDPPWILSSPLTEKKSVFLARVAPCTSSTLAQAYVAHLVATDKHAARATHNISAYRLHARTAQGDVNSGSAVQDNDDDGETAAGGRLGKLLEMMDVWDVVVVVSRWYGGVKLGPARFGLINMAAREALVNGGFVKVEKEKGGKKGKR